MSEESGDLAAVERVSGKSAQHEFAKTRMTVCSHDHQGGFHSVDEPVETLPDRQTRWRNFLGCRPNLMSRQVAYRFDADALSGGVFFVDDRHHANV